MKFGELLAIYSLVITVHAASLVAVPENPQGITRWVSYTLLILFGAVGVTAAAAVFSLFVRRARDAGNAALWATVAILITPPLGAILLAALPTKR